jgi:hypothetical protein
MVIEKTAARVMMSQLLTASGWVIPSGRFAVLSTYRSQTGRFSARLPSGFASKVIR